MKKRLVASGASVLAVALGATAVAGSATAVTPADAPSGVTADIYVALDYFPPNDGPMAWDLTDIPVGDGVELEAGTAPTANPSSFCGDAYVDISLEPFTVTFGGGEGYCNFTDAYVEITLHGAAFGTATLVSDELFGLSEGSGTPEAPAPIGKSVPVGAIPFALDAPFPTLQSFGATASTFSATWSGEVDALTSGRAVFSFAPITVTPREEAEGAAPVGAEPTFTG